MQFGQRSEDREEVSQVEGIKEKTIVAEEIISAHALKGN